jgi:hypothetical protein
MTRCAQRGTCIGGSSILPNDGWGNGLSGLPIPEHGGLTLIRDAHGSDVTRSCPRFPQHFIDGRALGIPDFVGIVLDPTRIREELSEFPLRAGHDVAVVIE